MQDIFLVDGALASKGTKATQYFSMRISSLPGLWQLWRHWVCYRWWCCCCVRYPSVWSRLLRHASARWRTLKRLCLVAKRDGHMFLVHSEPRRSAAARAGHTRLCFGGCAAPRTAPPGRPGPEGAGRAELGSCLLPEWNTGLVLVVSPWWQPALLGLTHVS